MERGIKNYQGAGDPGHLNMKINVRGAKVTCMIDLGANVNLMSIAKAQELGIDDEIQPCGTSVRLADNSTKKCVGEIVGIPMEIGGIRSRLDYLVMDMEGNAIRSKTLIGRPSLHRLEAVVDTGKKTYNLIIKG